MASNFVAQVAKTIRESSNVDRGGSFIFGISGKWGEGKTYFLDQLEEELDADYVVININPWKFASDKVAFLRHFLEQVNIGTGAKANLKDVYYDTTTNKLTKKWFIPLVFILAMVVICWVVAYPNQFGLSWAVPYTQKASGWHTWANIKKIKTLFLVLFTSLLLPPFLSLMTSQRKNSATTTTDEFDKILSDILREASKKAPQKKLVVYVDDLDRVTPKIARDVLDTLRTFFDIDNIVFVITGDHSVLERYIGGEILPNKDESEQIEEGRRYLKKIFNIYWRMLPPVDSDFTKFIDDYVKENYSSELDEFFGDSLGEYKKYLSEYFCKNYRQVIRFVDFTVFTYRAVKAYIDDSVEKDEFIDELLAHPLLLVKILLIQDLCNPLYEKILEMPSLLRDLEESIGKDLPLQFEKDLEKISTKLFSNNQREMCKKIFRDTEKFYDGPALRVRSLKPFLYLTSDEAWDNEGGAKPKDFFELAKTKDSSAILRAIVLSGQDTLESCADYTEKQLKAIENSAELEKPIRSIIGALDQLDLSHPAQCLFGISLSTIDFAAYYNGLGANEEHRIEFFQFVWNWLDKVWDEDWCVDNMDEFVSTFTPNHFAEDFKRLGTSSRGKASSTIIASWLVQYFNSGAPDCLDMITHFSPTLDKDAVETKFSEIADQLIDGVFQDPNLDNKTKRLDAIILLTPEEYIDKFKNRIFDEVKAFERDTVLWAFSMCDSGKYSTWTRGELEDKLIEGIASIAGATQFNHAFDLISIIKPKNIEKIWDALLTHHEEYFMTWLPHIRDGNFFNISPDRNSAKTIYTKIISKIKELAALNNGQANDYFACLYPDKWLWQTHHKIDQRNLVGLEKYVGADPLNQLKSKWEELAV